MNYHRAEDADKAVNTFNGLRLQNKTIKVKRKRKNKSKEKTHEITLFRYLLLVRALMPSKVLIYTFPVYLRAWPNRTWKIYSLHSDKLLHQEFYVITLLVICLSWNIRLVCISYVYFWLGLSKGVGFIRFDQRSEAERAIQSLNGTTPKTSNEPITVKFANNPSSNLNKAMPPLAAYLTPQSNRRFAGPIHHPTGRFR